MDYGENATRLSWRNAPELLINEESLVEVISKLRAQVLAIEKNELLSGTALPPWLLKALTDVASNVDAVIECTALQEQVTMLEKEVLEMRHEIFVQQSAVQNSGTAGGHNPTPHHRLSTGGRNQQRMAYIRPSLTTPKDDVEGEVDVEASVTAAVTAVTPEPVAVNYDAMVKPLWDAIHKQTNSFSSLKESFSEAKDTVARLQSEIKRRDAVVQARNSKHEAIVQAQVERLNENLRACVTRNDLINAEQRIGQAMKQDRERTVEELEERTNKLLEDILTSRADQEDINSTNAELLQNLSRKQAKMEDQLIDLMKKHSEGQQSINEMRMTLVEAMDEVKANTGTMDEFRSKVESFEETQNAVMQLSTDLKNEAASNGNMHSALESQLMDRIQESMGTLRGEIAVVNNTVNDLMDLNMGTEVQAMNGKIDVITLNVSDCSRKLINLQKQTTTFEDQSKLQFTQVFDSIDRALANMSTLSEESVRLSNDLKQSMDNSAKIEYELSEYKESNDRAVSAANITVQELHDSHEKHARTTENEIAVVKKQLFHVEDVNSTLKREIETTQHDVDMNFKNQMEDNNHTKNSLDLLFAAREEMNGRHDAAQTQMLTLQAENRLEIQAATAKLVAVVDKESDRVEALYKSFQEKQEHFADFVARSSIRNMDLMDMNRELDRLCEVFVSECWKFETSARSGAKTSDNNNPTTRKLFNERQQQLLVKNCQFMADLVVARAEYEVLHSSANKDVKNQHDMDGYMLEMQISIVEKLKMKYQTKIMNNKNIGEQFDKSSLDRRELYMETLGNMIDAAVKRRTMVGSNNNGGGGNGNYARERSDNSRMDGPGNILNSPLLESQRLMTTSAAGGLAGSNRKTSNRRSSALMNPGLSSDLDSNRPTFTPGSAYVYRAGFRLPKTAQSPPNSPCTPMVRKGSVSGEMGEGMLFLPKAFEGEPANAPHGEILEGWGTDEHGSSGLSTSVSLPALRQ